MDAEDLGPVDEYYFPAEPEIRREFKYCKTVSGLVVFASWLLPLGFGIWLGTESYAWYVAYHVPGPMMAARGIFEICCIVGSLAATIRLLEWGHRTTYERYKKIYKGEPVEAGMIILATFVLLCAILAFASGMYLLMIGKGWNP